MVKLSENAHFSSDFEKMLAESGINHRKRKEEKPAVKGEMLPTAKLIIKRSGIYPKSLDELRGILNSSQKLLSLDFEFYTDPKGNNWLREIAGKQFGSSLYFQYHLFNGEMTPERQLAFLQEYDMPYSEARKNNYFKIRRHLIDILASIRPDYVVSWGNSTDFNALDREEQRAHIRQKYRMAIDIPRIDLASLVGKEVFAGSSTLSLEKMGKLLGIKGTEPRHVALNDVRLIDRILQFYARDLNEDLFEN